MSERRRSRVGKSTVVLQREPKRSNGGRSACWELLPAASGAGWPVSAGVAPPGSAGIPAGLFAARRVARFSPGPRPEADALGRVLTKPTRPEGPLEIFEPVPVRSAEILAALQAAGRWGAVDPGHRPTGRSPGLESLDPSGRKDRYIKGQSCLDRPRVRHVRIFWRPCPAPASRTQRPG